MNKYSVGITGGAGYIGGSLARRLASTFDVKILDINEPRTTPKGSTFHHCDVRDYDSVSKCLSDVDLVIHAAIVQIPQITENKRLAYEVNILGTQNVCKFVGESTRIEGMILSSSWHTVGEHGIGGTIDESFGYRPDKVEPRARLYALSKIAQETVVRFYDESFEKTFGMIRMGTVLGQNMPSATAANIFIEKAIRGEAVTPFRNSMYRPMFYVDIDDVTEAYAAFATGILNGTIPKTTDSFSHIVNFFLPRPITILDLAHIVADSVHRQSGQSLDPSVVVVDKGLASPFTIEDQEMVHGDPQKSKKLLHLEPITSVRESIDKIVNERLRFR